MHILRLISSVDPANGGVFSSAKCVDEQLTKLGHKITVVCLDRADSSHTSDYPGDVYSFGPGYSPYKYSPEMIIWLKKWAHSFDIAIVDGLWEFCGYSAFMVLKKLGVPYIVFPHGMLDPWFRYRYPFKHLKKMLYWLLVEHRVLKNASAVAYTCEEERILARDSFWPYRANEVVTTIGTSGPPYGQSSTSIQLYQKFPELKDKRIFLFLSRIHEKKGCDLLIKAFAKVALNNPSLHLLMAGPNQSSWVSQLKMLAIQQGIADRITWPGMLHGNDKWDAFYSAEVFCLPSHQENFGIVVAEALACGKPVLISNKVNIWREIYSDGAGIVQADSLEGTTKALEQWLALTPVARQQMQRSARHCFDKRFRIDRVAESLINILHKYVSIDGEGGATRVGAN